MKVTFQSLWREIRMLTGTILAGLAMQAFPEDSEECLHVARAIQQFPAVEKPELAQSHTQE